MRGLKFAVARTLRQIAGDHDGCRTQRGQEVVECFDLLEIGVTAEVEIGEMDDCDAGRTQAATI
jgi:hypothetical protein